MIEVIALPLKEDSGKGHTIVEGNRAAVNAPVLETLSLTRRFGEHTAVDSLTVSVKRGEVFGLLGPNSAGGKLYPRVAT
jgi:ATPase subunit of ABC transporter with duplicated ATPase domains